MTQTANAHETCYACEEESTTDEHVPAECFFPEGSRKDLIKVPSCKRHNNDTSNDDEYVRNLIATQAENSEAGLTLLTGKVLRGFVHSPRLKAATFETLQLARTATDTPVLIFQPIRSRLDSVMLKIYRGIAFHVTRHQQLRPMDIHYRDLKFNDLRESNEYGLFKMMEKESIPWGGSVQEVFRFRVCTGSAISQPIIEIEFYRCFAVLMSPHDQLLHNLEKPQGIPST